MKDLFLHTYTNDYRVCLVIENKVSTFNFALSELHFFEIFQVFCKQSWAVETM